MNEVTVHIPREMAVTQKRAEELACEAYRRAFRKLPKVTLAMPATAWSPVNGHRSGFVVTVIEFKPRKESW